MRLIPIIVAALALLSPPVAHADYLGSWKIDDTLTFAATTHSASTGAATDADAVPGYRIYEDETGTPILTGSMALLDDANTVGLYSEQITLSAANGLEKGKTYTIVVSATVGSVAANQTHTFQIEAEVDAHNLRPVALQDAYTNSTAAEELFESVDTVDIDAAGSFGLYLKTALPAAAPGENGGLPTVDANNRIAGIQGTINTLDTLDTLQDTQHSNTQTDIAAVQADIDAQNGVTGTIDGGSATVLQVDEANVTASNQFVGATLTFAMDTTTVSLRGQGRRITATAEGSPDTITVYPAFSTAPQVGDTFIISYGDGSIPQTGDTYDNLPPNFAAMDITAGGDMSLGAVLGTALVETTPNRIANNMSVFWDNTDADTTNTVDDVGGGSSLTLEDINAEVDTALADIHLDDLIDTGTVNATGATTTSIPVSSITLANAHVGQIIRFDDDTTTPAMRGQSSVIVASTTSPVGSITVDPPLKTAPNENDAFKLFPGPGARYGLRSADTGASEVAKVGDQMDLVDAPNATAVTAIQSGLSTITTEQVNSEVDTALSDIGLQYLINTPLPVGWATNVAANSALDYMADDGTAVYDRSTDSLQAIRTEGDASWVGGGGSADWTATEREQLRYRLGIDGTESASVTNTDLNLGTVDANLLSILGTGITETNAGDVAESWSVFYDVDPVTTKTVNDVGVSGTGLTQQQVRDAMKLAPTAGPPDVGSIDEHLDVAQADLDIITGTGGVVIADDYITAAKIADNAIGATEIADGAIDAAALAADTITSAKIAPDAIGSSELATGAITTSAFAVGAIDAAAIATDAIGDPELAATAVNEIQSGLSTYDGSDTAGTTTLLTRLTAVRAGYLDNLSAGAPSTLTAQQVWEYGTRDLTSNGNDVTQVQVQAAALAAMQSIHLNHLFADPYDPTAKPGDPAGLWNVLLVNDIGVPQFSTNSLERAPTGDGGGAGGVSREDFIKFIALIARNDSALATDLAAELAEINQNYGTGGGSYDPEDSSLQEQSTNKNIVIDVGEQ